MKRVDDRSGKNIVKIFFCFVRQDYIVNVLKSKFIERATNHYPFTAKSISDTVKALP